MLAGLRRAGAAPALTEDPDAVRAAERVVLPGVGAFAAAMLELDATGVASALADRVRAGRATLAVCLGLQLLGEASEESPGARGLGVLAGTARRFPESVRVPQMGWNRVEPDAGCRVLTAGDAYFANSYRLVDAPRGWLVATSDHGGRFVAALERGRVLACQFHPELSGAWGLDLLRRWLTC
ncbi:MAG: imidazole glycerol phosphate synthase subunit HisH [Planctomycetes bacterium]|nr:imidazole glycerol phosphate synthase subunit HisH [Planctomycetota bacterium]